MGLKTLMLIYKLSRPMYTLVGEQHPQLQAIPRHPKGPYNAITFDDLTTIFISQFTINKAKRLEVADLFDIKQMKGENLKGYLTRFNSATVRVNDSDQKFFVKVFQKGLYTDQFNKSLALRRLSNIEVIRAQAEKHIEVEKDLANCLEVERQPLAPQTKPSHSHPARAHLREGGYRTNELTKEGKQRWKSREKEVDQDNASTPSKTAPSLPYLEDDVNKEKVCEGRHGYPRQSPPPKGPDHMFTDEDYKGTSPHQDDPMVILLIVTYYKIERVLIDQGSFANVLYWSTFQKLGLSISSLEECSRILFGFAREHVEKMGTMKIETVFGVGASAQTILVSYIVETNKLLAAWFIRELQYPTWLANVIMVKKHSGKWRMCTNYTDLNKACLKDPYPLSKIDRLVDGAFDCGLLSLMDAYSKYNQIRMHSHDETKNAFIIDIGTFYYKSTTVGEHYNALRRVYEVLKRHKLKFNPKKCSFKVQARKFLGFMLIERGSKPILRSARLSSA
ncbi:hypothetical protein CR513_22254, partial [Mucuna pruriens]